MTSLAMVLLLFSAQPVFAEDQVKAADTNSMEAFDRQLLTESDAQLQKLQVEKTPVVGGGKESKSRSARQEPSAMKPGENMPIVPGMEHSVPNHPAGAAMGDGHH